MSSFLKRINPIARILAYTRKENKLYPQKKVRGHTIEITNTNERRMKMWHRITDFFNVDYHKKYGEGTKFDLDYGKLLIIALCIYIAIKV